MAGVRINGSAATNKLRANGRVVLRLIRNGVTLWTNPGEAVNLSIPKAAVSVASPAPAVKRGHVLGVPVSAISTLARGFAVTAGTGVTVAVPKALVSALSRPPVVAGGATVAVPRAQVTSQAPAPSVTAIGGSTIAIPTAQISTQAQGMGFVVTAGKGVTVASPRALMTTDAKPPVVGVGVTIAIPKAEISAAAVPPAVFTFDGGRIDKTSTQTITPLSTNVKVTGWAANASTPNVVITNDGILVPAGVAVNYTMVLSVNQAPSTTTARGRAMLGTTLLQQVALGVSSTSVTITGSFTGTGEVLSMEAYMSSAGTSGRNVVNSGSYILVEKA